VYWNSLSTEGVFGAGRVRTYSIVIEGEKIELSLVRVAEGRATGGGFLGFRDAEKERRAFRKPMHDLKLPYLGAMSPNPVAGATPAAGRKRKGESGGEGITSVYPIRQKMQ